MKKIEIVRHTLKNRPKNEILSYTHKQEKTNLDENSKFVLFFTRDYFGLKIKR